jgi:hypothetical protein
VRSLPRGAEGYVAEILNSEEYRSGLRSRLLAGTCKAGELEIAARLGLQPGEADPDEAAKLEAMRRMPRYMRRVLMRLLRISNGSVPVPACREIQGPGGTVGLVFAVADETGPGARDAEPIQQDPAAVPETEPTETDDLLPPRRTT